MEKLSPLPLGGEGPGGRRLFGDQCNSYFVTTPQRTLNLKRARRAGTQGDLGQNNLPPCRLEILHLSIHARQRAPVFSKNECF